MPGLLDVTINLGDLVSKFTSDKRFVNRAVREALDKSAVDLQRKIKRNAPKRTRLLSRSLKVVVQGGAGGSATLNKMLVVVTDPHAEQYWLVREFGPRGGVIRGRPYLAFAFPGSPLFGKRVTASDVRSNPGAYGFDYTMAFNNVVYGVKRKTGKSWEQLYPGARFRQKRRTRNAARTPPVSKWFVPLFIIENEVSQKGSGYISSALAEETPKILARIARGITNRFNS